VAKFIAGQVIRQAILIPDTHDIGVDVIRIHAIRVREAKSVFQTRSLGTIFSFDAIRIGTAAPHSIHVTSSIAVHCTHPLIVALKSSNACHNDVEIVTVIAIIQDRTRTVLEANIGLFTTIFAFATICHIRA
jgi:hypothetical protein